MSADRSSSAERPSGNSGRSYHLDVGPDDVAPFVLLCGDPARAARVAARFERVEVERRHREYVTLTGRWGGAPVTVLATGIGADNTEIALIELAEAGARPTVLRVGSCGALPDGIGIGDLVVSTAAVRLESTSLAYVPPGFPAVAHPEVVLALAAACAGAGHRHAVGLTATAAGFYAAQGRTAAGLAPRDPGLLDQLRRLGVLNLEMETSCLLTLATLLGLRAGALCAVYADRSGGSFASEAERDAAEARAIDAALGAVAWLRRLDAARGDAARWHPGLGLG